MSKRFRAWCFTLNNYDDVRDLIKIKDNLKKAKYWVIGKEVGSSGTKHLQGYVYYKNAISFKSIQKKLLNRAHVEIAKGNAEQNLKYCSKDGDFEVFGEMPKQGKRSDLDIIKEYVQDGGQDLKEIYKLSSNLQAYKMGQVGIQLFGKKRNFKTKVYWFYGPTGTGKTKKAVEDCGEDVHFQTIPKWWDGYNQQENVIIDDYRRDIFTFTYLLRLLDRYPMTVETKGGTQNFTSKNIYITCNKSPAECWEGRCDEDIDQLLRRIDVIQFFGTNENDTEVGGNTMTPTSTIENEEKIITQKIISESLKCIKKDTKNEMFIGKKNIQVEDEDIQSKKLFVKRSIKMQKKKQSMEQIQQASPVLERPYYKYHTQLKELELTKESEIK